MISRGSSTHSINSGLQYEEKTATQKRLIRTSIAQIEKPTLHSRRYGTDSYKSKDVFTRRVSGTEVDRYSRDRYDNSSENKDNQFGKRPYRRSYTTANDIESKSRLFSEDSKTSNDDFYPKSSYLRHRLNEIGEKQIHRKQSSLDKLGLQSECEIDAYIEAFKENKERCNKRTAYKNSFSEPSKSSNDQCSNLNASIGSHKTSRSSLQSNSSSSIVTLPKTSRSASITGIETNPISEEIMNYELKRNSSLPPKNRISNRSALHVSNNLVRSKTVLASSSLQSLGNINSASTTSLEKIDSVSRIIHNLKESPSVLHKTKLEENVDNVAADHPSGENNWNNLHAQPLSDICNENIYCHPSKSERELVTDELCLCQGNDKKHTESAKESVKMECELTETKSPITEDRRGSLSLFSITKRSHTDELHKRDGSPNKSTLSSYFHFKKDKMKKDDTQLSQTTVKDVSIDIAGKNISEQSGGIISPPISPNWHAGQDRRGSGIMRLFHKKNAEIRSHGAASLNKDVKITNNKLSKASAEETPKLYPSTKEPTKIRTRMKYIDTNIEKLKATKLGEIPSQSIQASIKQRESVSNMELVDSNINDSKSLDIEIPDKVSITNDASCLNQIDLTKLTKADRRSRRRDRRKLALSEIATAVEQSEENVSSSINDASPAVVVVAPPEKEVSPSMNAGVSVDIKENENVPLKAAETFQLDVYNISTTDSSYLLPQHEDDTYGSADSLYGSDTSSKGHSYNKDRIKYRKAVRKEAEERRQKLSTEVSNTDFIESGISIFVTQAQKNAYSSRESVYSSATSLDNEITNTNDSAIKRSPPEVLPKKRKKHKVKRSNTTVCLPKPDLVPLEVTTQDDGIVMKRNNRRNIRKDRPRTLTSGIDPKALLSARTLANEADAGSGVVQENMSFAEIKKKLLEGVKVEKKESEKVPVKERQKIKRTKSSKRYKTITEGIAPRDLAIAAQQAMEDTTEGSKRKLIDQETMQKIAASLSSVSDKRKSYRVDSVRSSWHQSRENLSYLDGDVVMKDDSRESQPIHRAKSMTTLHMHLDLNKDENEDDDELAIKPLSELKNRFLKAMEDTKQKHLQNKTVVDIKSKGARGSRVNRPHTICGLDDWTVERFITEVGNTPENDLQKFSVDVEEHKMKTLSVENASSVIVNKDKSNSIRKEEKEKAFDDIFKDINAILDTGVTDVELADKLGFNPSYNQGLSTSMSPAIGQQSKKEEVVLEAQPEITSSELSDLDFISSQSSQLTTSQVSDKRKLRPQRRHRTGANPIKALQNREDLVDEKDIKNECKSQSSHPVVEAYRGLNASDAKQNPADRILRRTDLADEAVSALRATVDFSKTKLKKVITSPGCIGVLEETFKPTEITSILMQIKGRRKVQTTLVKFSHETLNANDCFIILTPRDLQCWYGAQANVIERAKASEVASRLFQKKEMGCKAFDVLYVEQNDDLQKKVLRTLGGDADSKINIDKLPVRDEDFEKTIISAYMTYIVCERNDPPELIPLDSQCHRLPSKEILQTDSAFVFDFIHEVYVWLGRQTNSVQRKLIQKLAAQKFDEGYYKLNMESTSHQPHGTSRHILFTPTNRRDSSGLGGRLSLGRRASNKARRHGPDQGRHQMEEKVPRSDHSILVQLFEGSEWVLFKEKFCDWPDESRIIRMKGGPEHVGELTKVISTEIIINPVDPKEMIKPAVQQKMILEMTDIGRGRGVPKGMDGYHCITLDVKTWHVSENNSILMPDHSFGQFHSGEGYVIRWQYRIVKVRALRNCPDIMKAGGQERCCYFFWLGNDCSVNEEGATAVMTIELDKEKGPQKRVVLGKEPPALLNLFDGSMIIHAGKRPVPGIRDHYTDNSIIRLYCVRNEECSEACLLQVPPFCESLRSRSSFVLLVCEQGEVLLWHGCYSNRGTRASAEHASKQLIANHPDEASISNVTEIGLIEIEEGEEPDEFWMLLGGKEDYGSMLDDKSDISEFSPRLFQLESATGKFLATEIISPSKTDNHNCPFPVLQDDLYNLDQPAIFLMDAVSHIYLWFGWWPDNASTEAANSRRRRWDEERRKAMESAVFYAEELKRPLQNLYAIYAGLEPESFIELFPYWVVQEDITDLQIDEGIEEDKLYKITEELAMFTKEFYSIDELRSPIPPQGVDPTKLEKYLSDEDFLAAFGFTREAYFTLPGWQQVNWKKKLGLY